MTTNNNLFSGPPSLERARPCENCPALRRSVANFAPPSFSSSFACFSLVPGLLLPSSIPTYYYALPDTRLSLHSSLFRRQLFTASYSRKPATRPQLPPTNRSEPRSRTAHAPPFDESLFSPRVAAAPPTTTYPSPLRVEYPGRFSAAASPERVAPPSRNVCGPGACRSPRGASVCFSRRSGLRPRARAGLRFVFAPLFHVRCWRGHCQLRRRCRSGLPPKE